MFGTIFRMQPKPGQEQAVEEVFQQWQREYRPKVAGFVAGYLFTSRSHPRELVGIAIFDSEANYRKNAEDPEQDRWYQNLRAALEADPEWNDGEIIALEEGKRT